MVQRIARPTAGALSWNYRKQNILKEIVGHNADILCLQEVQSDHFEDFFAGELAKYGKVRASSST